MRFLRDGIFFTLLFFSTGVGSDYNYNNTYDKHDDDKILSRKRRFLNFPEGSTFVMTLSNTKGLVWDIPLFMPPWNNIMEFDLIFKLTNVTKLFLSKKASQLHRQERSNFYRQLEDFIDIFDFDGRACIFKTLCEAREALRPGMSFMEDLMHALFTFSGNSREVTEDGWKQEDCPTWNSACPFSLLQVIMNSDIV